MTWILLALGLVLIIEGMLPFPTTGSYVATKYAVLGLSQFTLTRNLGIVLVVLVLLGGLEPQPGVELAVAGVGDHHRPVGRFGMGQTDGVAATLVIGHTVGTPVGHAPAVRADQRPAHTPLGQVRRPCPARSRSPGNSPENSTINSGQR